MWPKKRNSTLCTRRKKGDCQTRQNGMRRPRGATVNLFELARQSMSMAAQLPDFLLQLFSNSSTISTKRLTWAIVLGHLDFNATAASPRRLSYCRRLPTISKGNWTLCAPPKIPPAIMITTEFHAKPPQISSDQSRGWGGTSWINPRKHAKGATRSETIKYDF